MPASKTLGRPRATDLRYAIDALSYLLRGGGPWRLPPEAFPPRSTVQRCFQGPGAKTAAWLGRPGLPSVLLIGAVTALLGVVILPGWARLTGRSISGTDPIPFGTFLAIGIWIVRLYGPLTF